MTTPTSNLDRAQLRALLEQKLREKAEAARVYPLGNAQKGLWLKHQVDPTSVALNISFAARIRSDVNVGALEQAVGRVVARHPSLRARISFQNGEPIHQVVEAIHAFAVVDGTGLSPDALRARVTEEAYRPFDLMAGPLIRASLFTGAPDGPVLLLTAHHLISDYWSLVVLLDELREVYPACCAGRDPALPKPEGLYADFVAAEAKSLAGPRFDELWQYWQQKLAGELPVLQLPTDFPRPAVQGHRGASHPFRLDAGLTQALKELSRSQGVTLYVLLLAAYQVLLARLSGQDDVIVGTVTAGRLEAAFARTVGCFVNPVALRANLAENPTFAEFLAQVRTTVVGGLEHQEFPFLELANRLASERDLSVSPIFQAAFMLEKSQRAEHEGASLFFMGHPGTRLEVGGLVLEPFALEHRAVQYDLLLMMEAMGEHLYGSLQYCSEIFTPETVQRMAAQYITVLEQVVVDPFRRISEISLLTEADRRQILVEWNRSEAPYPKGVTGHRLFAAVAAGRPDAAALVMGDRHLSYRDLNAKANQLARRLMDAGVGKGEIIGVFMERSPEQIIALLAIWKAGAAYLPLDPSYPADRLAFMVADAEVSVVLTQPHLTPPFAGRVLAVTPDLFAGEACEVQNDDVAADDVAYVIYTSGSTGRPKGVMVAHRGLGNLAMAQHHALGIDPGTRVLQFASSSFDASIWEIVGTLLNGGVLHLAPQEALMPGPELLRTLKENAIEVVTLPPSAAALLPETELPALKTLVTAGEACSADLVRRWAPGRRYINAYGPTETTVCATLARVTPEETLPSIGRAIQNFQVYLLDKHGQPVPVGVPGELYVGGVGVALGYLKRPDLTEQRFVPNPFGEGKLYRTGDLARWRPDGNLEFLGRVDHQVKVRGYRIELGEIETVIRRHEGVREVVVLARGDQLVAYAMTGPTGGVTPPEPGADPTRAVPGAGLTEADLRSLAQQHLPSYMVPNHIVLLDAFPLTPSGKVDRKALPSPVSVDDEAIAYRTPMEQVLAGLWAEVLGGRRPRPQENFFELGGHSLSGTRLMARIREICGVELPLKTLFEAPTLEALALRVAWAVQGTADPILPIPRDGAELPLSFAQQRLWFLDQLEPDSAAYNIPGALRLKGRLDTSVLERAVTELVRRHEVLRSQFVPANGRPVLRIAPAEPVSIPVVTVPAGADLRRLMEEEATAPFNLATGPLLRVKLLAVAPDEHLVLMTMHHIVSDGWSVEIAMRELATLYGAYAQGQESPLPELPVQYLDVAAWQRRTLTDETMAPAIAYWKQQLAEPLPVLALPTDKPRTAVRAFDSGQVTATAGRSVTAALTQVCRQEGATPFMVTLAAFALLLSRLSGQMDLTVGTPVSSRTRVEMERMVGMFLNTLVLRCSLEGAPTFRELVRRVREAALGAYAHQEVPFEKLVEMLRPERNLGQTPLFQVMFNFVNVPAVSAKLPGLEAELLPELDHGAKFDLTMYATEAPEGIDFQLVYNADLFGAERAAEVMRQFVAILAQAAAEPDRPVTAYSLANEAVPNPTAPLHFEWNGPLHELIGKQDPTRLAVDDGREPLTYGELNAASNRIANALLAAGLPKLGVVAVYGARSSQFVAAMLGVMKAGGAWVVLDPNYPAARHAEVLEIAKPFALVECQPCTLVTDALRISGGTNDNTPTINVGPNDLAYLAFTSGSTGKPKGVMGTHAPLRHFIDWHIATFGFTADDRFSMLSGLAHDPLLRDLFTPLCCGAVLCIPAQEAMSSPWTLGPWARQAGITVAHVTPAMAQLLAAGGALPSLKHIFFGGDLLKRGDVETLQAAAPNVSYVNFYGATETPQGMGHYIVSDPATAPEIIPVGKGIDSVQLLILNEARGLAGVGELGEIAIRTPYLCLGYLGDAAATAAKFITNPFTGAPEDRVYLTGDLGRFLPDGSVELLGRADGQVKIRGFRIEKTEVEAAIEKHPAVRDAVVTVREARGDKDLVAYVVPQEGATLTPDDLRSFLAERLPRYMVPAAYAITEKIPLTPNGKIDTARLPAVEASTRAESTYTAPQTELEQSIAAIWREVLQTDRVGLHDNFFDLGGHSMLVLQVQNRLRHALGRDIPLMELFREPTVSALAACLSRQQPDTSRADEARERARKQREALLRQAKRARGSDR
jgi:amino acid adenylation domain-containing protein